MEIWKEINNTKYYISSKGQVLNGLRNKLLKGSINKKNGYIKVTIYTHSYFIHRLVAQHFIFNPKHLPQVNHKDGNKLNNCMENLEWCTDRENTIHAFKSGMYDSYISDLSIPIEGVNIKTGNIVRFNSASEAGRNGFNQANISSCLRGERKSHMGYKWRKL